MKQYRNEAVERALLKKMLAKMDDPTRSLNGPWHASDLYSCWRMVLEKRRNPVRPDRAATIRFMVGYAIEAWLMGEDKDRTEYLGVLFTPDGKASNDSLLEMKTTGKYMAKFDGVTKLWLTRTAAYCAVRGIKQAHVCVYFIYQRDIRVFTLEFTDAELAAVRKDIPRRVAALDGYRERGELPPVTTRMDEAECAYCPVRKLLHCDEEFTKHGMTAPKWAGGNEND